MSTKERILRIRLMEKLESCPDYAKILGIEIGGITALSDTTEKKEE